MPPTNELVQALTDSMLPPDEKRGVAETFSRQFGWRPNDFLDVPDALPASNLIVEHGLDNAAMLSFMPSHRRLEDIQLHEKLNILGLSYNSLIDWHIWIDQHSIRYIYNRTDPPQEVQATQFSMAGDQALTRRLFDEAIGLAPNPNILSLDGALLDTISTWRKILALELGDSASTESVSSLFNAIILARAIEDLQVRTDRTVNRPSLMETVAKTGMNIPDAIQRLIITRTGSIPPSDLFDRRALSPFERLSWDSQRSLIQAFYRHESVPYQYDFSVMSKHALSKIYERYVAVMQHEESIQFSLFPATHEETWNKQLGGIYTPQYIASFFVRYLQGQLPSHEFLASSVADPACGSGVFLRALMEQKLLTSGSDLERNAGLILESLSGVDVDENAVAASRLSLALLYLAACGELPKTLPIEHDDSIVRFAPNSTSQDDQYDAVIANPPFVRTESQPGAVRRAVSTHLETVAKGKLDTYLAFLVFSIRALRPGGYGFFVVPQPLLTSDNLKSLRDWLRHETWVHVIADLSAIRVFRANVYVALLIVQRKGAGALNEPSVGLIRCQRDVGIALEDYLDGNHRQTSSYFIFKAPQRVLDRQNWSVVTPQESDLLGRLEAMPQLNDLAVVRQGAITGADEVFLVDRDDVPVGEEALYRPLLPDRMIGRFRLPPETGQRILYPYVDGVAITAPQLETDFPQTWKRLRQHMSTLTSRKSVAPDGTDWWRPTRPRPPHEMLVPKIVVPEVSLLPRFGLDLLGHWVVSHSPFVRARTDRQDEDLLLVLAAVLNSSASTWFIDLNARKYREGYNKIGVALLRRMPIPDLTRVHSAQISQVVGLVRQLITPSIELEEAFEDEAFWTLDTLVMRDLYGLSDHEIALVRPEAPVS
ncbi:MAG: N-6 DNA methylase [Bryobacterales bacterium]|nr:N-6 DNA methylase [Bryobacterales bacterium]